jgi:hypothetical protein
MTATFGFKRRVLALAAGAMLVTLLAACGGDKKDDNKSASDAPTATTAAGSTNTGNTGASSTPVSGATSTASGSTSAGFSNLNSYKYTLKMSGSGGPVGDITDGLAGAGINSQNVVIEFNGAYIKPDKAQVAIKVGNFETSTTVIGTQQWNTFAGQTQGPLPATQSDLEDANFLLGFWQDDDISQNIDDFKCSGKENVNGVSAQKCSADKSTLEKVAKDNPEFLSSINASSLSNAQIDVWLADGNYPVRMRMDVSGKDTENKDFNFKVDMDVTDINGNFQITAPKT